MTNVYYEKLKLMKNISAERKNEELIRNLSCEIAALAPEKERETAVDICREKLRELENEKNRRKRSCRLKTVRLGNLFESALISADTVLTEKGKRLEFTLEDEKTVCDPELIIDAFLNLISNSARFGKGKIIRISLYKNEGFNCFSVINEGNMDFNEFLPGKGLSSCMNIARLHGGRLLFSTDGKSTCAAFSFLSQSGDYESWSSPCFTDYLEDSFSRVRIGLSTVKS